MPRCRVGVSESRSGVGEPLAQREFTQARMQQRLERVGQRPAQQLDDLTVDQLPQHRAGTVAPVRIELDKLPLGFGMLTGSEAAQCFRC